MPGSGPERRRRLTSGMRKSARNTLPMPEWIADAAASSPRVMLCGWEKLLVENCGEVSAFSPELVVLSTRIGPLRVEGEGLELRELRANAVLVRGRVRRVTMPCDDA